MQSQRWAWTHRHAVPMFVASVVAVILAGSALVGVLIFARGGEAGGETPNGTPGAGETPSGVETTAGTAAGPTPECVTGSWRMVSETRETEGLTLRIQEGEPRTEFRPDGTGTTDYGDRTVLSGTYLLLPVTVTVAGTLTFRYEASEGTVDITELIENDTEMTADSPGLELDDPEGAGLLHGAHETDCDQQSMRLHLVDTNVTYTAEYEREP